MSTTYEQTTTTQHSSSGDGIGVDKFYLRSWKGILKVAQAVLCLIAFICASVHIGWSAYGGGWVQFVTMSAFILTLVLYFGHLFRFIYKLPGPWGIIELIYYAVFSLLLLISGIVAATRAHYHSSIVFTTELIYYAVYTVLLLIAAIVAASRSSWHGSVLATAVFTFAATACFVVELFFLFRDWQAGRTTTSRHTEGTTTTVTSKETYETRAQY